MPEESMPLMAMGGLYETTAEVKQPRDEGELIRIFNEARQEARRVTLIGARRSFGEHFLPPPGALGLDTTALHGSVRRLDTEPDGSLWVSVPGSYTFERLCAEVVGYLPFHPPTGDRITLSGALVACGHDDTGFFATNVRAFTLITPTGRSYHCHGDAEGLERELFDAVPGSFGALGVITSIEIRLRKVEPQHRVEINVVDKCPTEGYRAFDGLEAAHARGDFEMGRGVFVLGHRGTSVLLGHRLIVPKPGERAPALFLAEDSTIRNIVLQGLANRMPGPIQKVQPLLFKKGRCFHATPYGFLFFQRSYDRAYELLSSDRWIARCLRAIGVDPRLTVCHQTFVIPHERVRRFLDLYLSMFDQHRELTSRLELQDMIRLPECRWPLHAAHGMRGGCFAFTASFSVRRDADSHHRASAFLSKVTQRAYEELGVNVLLLKQAHCETKLLRDMHDGFMRVLEPLRKQVDPHQVLTSRLLARLTGGTIPGLGGR